MVSLIHTEPAVCKWSLLNPRALWLIRLFSWSAILCVWRHWINICYIYPALASTRFRIHGVFRNFHSGERIKKVADSKISRYVWTGPKWMCFCRTYEQRNTENCWRGSLRKQLTFGDATTGFPAKWRFRNERGNSILITRHYPDLVQDQLDLH